MYLSGDSVLLMKRTDENKYWAFPAGKIEDNETELEAAVRESIEETGKTPDDQPTKIDFYQSPELEFTTFISKTDRFEPSLCEEHSEFMWADYSSLPSNLHPVSAEIVMKTLIEEKTNANQFPKIFYCRHMQPGTCQYDNETILIDTDAMKRLIATGSGKPVYIGHPSSNIVARLKNLKEEAVGYIADSFYNPIDGWAWFKFFVIDEKAHAAVQNAAMSVSNAYAAFDWGAGGTKNAVEFKRELLDGEITQVAIVPNPRYEGAKIYTPDEFKIYQDSKKRELEELTNSKPEKENEPMFFRTKKEEVKAGDTIGDDVFTEIKNDDGTVETVKVKDLIELKREEIRNAKTMKKNDDDKAKEYDIDGEKVTQDMLEDCYRNSKKNSMKKNEKKNSEDDEDAKKEEKKREEEKKNADDSEAKKKEADNKKSKDEDEEEKKNSLYFEELSNANKKREEAPPAIQTSQTQLQRGKDRYGSKK